MFQFVAASRSFIKEPDINFFFSHDYDPISDEDLLNQIKKRGSIFLLLDFEAPPMVEDIIYPQLRKAEQSIRSLFKRNGFSLLRSDFDCHDVDHSTRARMIFEFEVGELPNIIRRIGPPIWEAEHLTRFLSSHSVVSSGPYIDDGRVVVEVRRTFNTAQELLKNNVSTLSLGKHLSKQVQSRGYNIYVGSELAQVKDPGFRIFIARYLKSIFRMC
jgi:tRNA nucleotidyltransferase (CCA-adding enzyme)